MPKDWKGDIVFSDSMAIFRGHVGDNKSHSHWASQITIALDGELQFETASGFQSSKAAFFASKTVHRLVSGFVCSIYFDPLSDSVFKTCIKDATDGWRSLACNDLPEELRGINASTNLENLLSSLAFNTRPPSEDRLPGVIREIRARLAAGEDIDRDSLARSVSLSPTRFSHWFVEQTGMPLRGYKKWLKLRIAMDALLEGRRPTDAAMLAGFSDLAHMSRAFSESFGLTYLDAQKAWEQSTQT